MRRGLAAALIVASLSATSACEWRGLNSLSLPGTEGSDDGSYTIEAQLPDVVVIQQNTRVRVADVNVGNVTKIEVQDWHALVTMRINGDVHLPANSTAKVGQTSLLGSMHIELAPPTDEPPEGELKDGSVIPLSRASTYPTTEQTLASVSILLNGGGLGQLQEINQTFATALAGRENDMRSLLTQLIPSPPNSTPRPTTSSPPPRVSIRWPGRLRRRIRPSTGRSPRSRRRWPCCRIPAPNWRTPSTRSANLARSPPRRFSDQGAL